MKRKPKWSELDEFTKAYITCALWATNDESDDSGGEPLDKNYDYDNITAKTVFAMIADCKRFQAENAELIATGETVSGSDGPYTPEQRAGHDFWLTRHHHGAGFWDGDWRTPWVVPSPGGAVLVATTVGDLLTEASQKYGEFYLEVYRGKISTM